MEDDTDELKKKLRTYKKEDILFNDPHFSEQLTFRDGNLDEIIDHILNPEKLVYSFKEIGKHGDIKHNLHFAISNTRTLRLPIIFDKGGSRNIFILTYIMRYRNWQNMVKKR